MSERNVTPLFQQVFRHTRTVTMVTAKGETVEGRGIISALRRETGEPGGKRHPLGTLSRPMYRFLGYLPEAANAIGGTLAQGELRCRVLDLRPVLLAGRQLGVRALLEREEE